MKLSIFEKHRKEFTEKEQLALGLLATTIPKSALHIEDRILSSTHRIAFLVHVDADINEESVDHLIYNIMQAGYNVLPTRNCILYGENSDIPCTSILGIIDERIDRLTRENTIFLKKVPTIDKTSVFRIEFYCSRELEEDPILTSESFKLYLVYQKIKMKDILFKQILHTAENFKALDINGIQDKEGLNIMYDKEVQNFFYDIVQHYDGKVFINSTIRLSDNETQYYDVLGNFYEHNPVLPSNQNKEYILTVTQGSSYSTLKAYFEYSPTGNLTYSVMTEDEYNCIVRAGKSIMKSAELLEKNGSKNGLYDLACKVIKSDVVVRDFYNGKLFSSFKLKLNNIRDIWLLSGKSEEIKNLTFYNIWSMDELKELDIVYKEYHTSPNTQQTCCICNTVTNFVFEDKPVCSKNCLDALTCKYFQLEDIEKF